MNNKIVIGPRDNLIEAVANLLQADNKDFSDCAVIFPGKRPAHFLRKSLAERIRTSYIPPIIFSINEFIQHLFELINVKNKIVIETLDAVAILYEVHNNMKDGLGKEHFRTFDSFIPIGLKLFEELEELCLGLISEKRMKEELSTLTFNNLFSIPDYYQRFYKLLGEKNYATRALQYKEVADNIDKINLDNHKQVIFAGLYKQTPAENIILDNLAKRANIYFIYQTDKLDADSTEAEIHFIKAPDTHGQVFALASILEKEIKSGTKLDERSVIVMPSSETLFPLLHHTLSILSPEDYNIALGYPILRTPVYGFIHNLIELLSRKQDQYYPVKHYLKFILHPYTKNIRLMNRSDATRMLFHSIETSLIENSMKDHITLEEIEETDGTFSNLSYILSESDNKFTPEILKDHLKNIHLNTIKALEQVSSLKDFAEKINSILNYIFEHSTASRHPFFKTYAETFIQIFESLQNTLAANMHFKNLSSYIDFIKHYLSTQRVPFSGTPVHGLQILGLLETRGLSFENVYFLNANEHIIPGHTNSYTLIPQNVRAKLGLDTIKQKDEMSEYYFNLLLRSAKRIHIFYEESDRKEKSRFVEQLIWKMQKEDKTYSTTNYIKTVRYQINLANKEVQPIPKSEKTLSVLNGFTFSASSLDTYLNCQIEFYYRNVLRLTEKEEVNEDVDAKSIGSFVHAVLKQYFNNFKGMKLESKDIDQNRMNELIEEIFIQNFGTELSGSKYLLKRQIQKQLINMLTNYQLPLLKANHIHIVDLEKKLTAEIAGAKFFGQLDRIEKRNDKIIIIDYKTSAKPDALPISFNKLDIDNRETWNKAVNSLQLPLYLLIYSIESGTPVEQIKPAYLYLGNNPLNVQSEVFFIENDTERSEHFPLIQTLIEKLIAEIQDASIPFLPPSDLDKSCLFCSFKELCGTHWITKY